MNQMLYFIKKLSTFGGIALKVNLAGMILLSLFDGIGILILLIMIKTSGIMQLQSSGPSILKNAVTIIQGFPGMKSLLTILLFYLFVITLQTLLQRKMMIRNVKIQTEFIRQLRLETYEAIMNSNWKFFIKVRKSDLIHLLTSEIARVHSGTNLCLDFLSSFVFTIVQIGFAYILSPTITTLVLVCGFFLSFFSRKYIKKARRLGNQTSELAQSYLAGITDQMNGIKDIKSNKLERTHLSWFRNLTKKMVDEQVEYIVLNTSSQSIYKLSSAILIAIFLYLSMNIFHNQSEQFVIIIMVFSRLWPRVAGIQSSIEKIASLTPSFQALMELQDSCKNSMEYGQGTDQPIELKEGIECKQITFRYKENQDQYALKEIDLFIPVNKMTAVVGKSGAGKSTFIDILMGLLQPEQGEVLVDGKLLINETIASLRNSLSYVPQEPFLFNTTIKENMLLVKPDANDADIWEALEYAAAADFVKKCPDGLETVIGDRGIRLSGGERQRLVLARAILRKPAILILDEATSALDTHNEAKIQGVLERLKGSMTIIVIAHRLSTIRNADQVVVLEQGRVAQVGDFSQLEKERRGIFSHLLRSQTNFILQKNSR